ncbi:MAG: PRC-barrel domain containing protein [bacterium]
MNEMPMNDELGEPTSYFALEGGTDVFASNGEKVGTVVRVFRDEAADIFDGLQIALLPLGRNVYAVADLVDEIFERGVLMTIDEITVQALPDPAGP